MSAQFETKVVVKSRPQLEVTPDVFDAIKAHATAISAKVAWLSKKLRRDLGEDGLLASAVAKIAGHLLEEDALEISRPIGATAAEKREKEEKLVAEMERIAGLRARDVEDLQRSLGADRIEKVAIAVYRRQMILIPVTPAGTAALEWDDPDCAEYIRDQYRWMAGIALEADGSE